MNTTTRDDGDILDYMYFDFIDTFVYTKLCNYKAILIKNVEYDDNLKNEVIKDGLIYLYYAPIENNKDIKSILILGVNDDYLNNNVFVKDKIYINDFITILENIKQLDFSTDFSKHVLNWVDQQLIADYLDSLMSFNIELRKSSGLLKDMEREVVTYEISQKCLDIWNINPETVNENTLNFLKK